MYTNKRVKDSMSRSVPEWQRQILAGINSVSDEMLENVNHKEATVKEKDVSMTEGLAYINEGLNLLYSLHGIQRQYSDCGCGCGGTGDCGDHTHDEPHDVETTVIDAQQSNGFSEDDGETHGD